MSYLITKARNAFRFYNLQANLETQGRLLRDTVLKMAYFFFKKSGLSHLLKINKNVLNILNNINIKNKDAFL